MVPLTKEIHITYSKEQDIYVYEEGQIIFMLGKKFSFHDLLSCSIDKVLIRKGRTTQVTTPDKREMAEQQVLWGIGQKYNVRTATHIETSPDIYKYVIYVGIRSISEPQISFSVRTPDVANEIYNLINVIINARQQP